MVGSGPAGLMLADRLSLLPQLEVHCFEKRSDLGRKIKIAGSSGLNLTYQAGVQEMAQHYNPTTYPWAELLEQFPPEAWLKFVESLGVETFLGTSRRYFIVDKTAVRLLGLWKDRLTARGVVWHLAAECIAAELLPAPAEAPVRLSFAGQEDFSCDYVCFALGGGSWEPDEKPLRWPALFAKLGVKFEALVASNVGYRIDWALEFLKEVEGQPLKNVVLHTGKGERRGDVVITAYGMEGTPVYFVGQEGPAWLDLKPDLSLEQLREKALRPKENLSPLRRLKKTRLLDTAALALLYHQLPVSQQQDLESLLGTVKRFPLQLLGPQPIEEAISTRGGIALEEVASDFSLKRFPRAFAVGEMLAWDAPTGGFLIQACVSQAVRAAQGLQSRLVPI